MEKHIDIRITIAQEEPLSDEDLFRAVADALSTSLNVSLGARGKRGALMAADLLVSDGFGRTVPAKDLRS